MISAEKELERIKQEIHESVKKFLEIKRETKKFIPKVNKVQYCEPLYDEKEMNAAVDSLLSGWLPEGENTSEFESEFAKFIGTEDCVVTVSGSAALLLSFATLKNRFIDNHMNEGDEVITAALTFPTSVSSIILNGLVPVFVDVDENFNINPEQIEKMISSKTRAILVMHHLGNPCQMDRIMEIAKKHNLFMVEDCCDGHGATYKGKRIGSFGNMGCFSFYGAHAMFMGEGGAITVKERTFSPTIRSIRTCGGYDIHPKRSPIPDPKWDAELKKLPEYDARTITMNLGYKFRILDLQAAIGREQLKRLPEFIRKRQQNVDWYNEKFRKYEKFFRLPESTPDSMPSWFAYPLTIRKDAPFRRKELLKHLEQCNIETRPLLGGNLLKHPAFWNVKHRASELPNTEFFHQNSFYIGCYPGLTEEMKEYVVSAFDSFMEKYL